MDMRDTDAQTVVVASPKWLESTITLITLQAIILDDYLRTCLSFFQNKNSYLEKKEFLFENCLTFKTKSTTFVKKE